MNMHGHTLTVSVEPLEHTTGAEQPERASETEPFANTKTSIQQFFRYNKLSVITTGKGNWPPANTLAPRYNELCVITNLQI